MSRLGLSLAVAYGSADIDAFISGAKIKLRDEGVKLFAPELSDASGLADMKTISADQRFFVALSLLLEEANCLPVEANLSLSFLSKIRMKLPKPDVHGFRKLELNDRRREIILYSSTNSIRRAPRVSSSNSLAKVSARSSRISTSNPRPYQNSFPEFDRLQFRFCAEPDSQIDVQR